LDFLKSQILFADETSCITLPTFVKIRQSVVGLWQFFDSSGWQLPPSWVSISKMLLADEAQRTEMPHHAKFHQNWPFHREDRAIFFLKKVVAAPS